MFRCVDRIGKKLRIAPQAPQTGLRSAARRWSLLLAAIATFAGVVPGVRAQDLSRYGVSPISIIAGSSTATESFANGVPATSVGLTAVQAARVDAAGNVYFIQGTVVRMLYVSGPVPSILQNAVNDYAMLADAASQPTSATGGQGNVYSLMNVEGSGHCASTCGDGGSAVTAILPQPYGLALDSAGNLYVADLNTYSVRKMSATDGKISTVAGDPQHAQHVYNGDGLLATASYLTSPTAITFDASNNLFIADLGSNLVRRVDAQTQTMTTVAGNPAHPGTYCSDTTCGEGGAATSALLGGVFGVGVDPAGDIYIAENGLHVVREVAQATGLLTTVAGTRGVPCADKKCGGEGVNATAATLNSPQAVNVDANGGLIIADSGDQAIRGVTTGGKIYTLAGKLSQTPGVGNLSGAANSVKFMYPAEGVIDPSNHLIIADTNPFLWEVAAPTVVMTQTITFNQIPDAAYGDASFDLTRYASSSSALALTFTCTGAATCAGTNGATLTIKGAGPVTVTANQAGNATYGAASPETSTFNVAKATLTVKANDISFLRANATQLPPLTFSFAGFVNGDSSSVVTGAPVLSTTATAASGVGEYPISVALGTLAASNYTFVTQSATLIITNGNPQTITFGALPNVTYGAGTITLAATASSGDTVAFTASGPVELLGNKLTITGVGTVSVTATQVGDVNYGPATPVTQSFKVAPAVLNIAAQPATRAYNSANPAFAFTATGFVGADTTSVLSGGPAFSTTATMTSAPGSYPITISQGTLFALNYTFTFTDSTLTVGLAPQTINFPVPPRATFGTSIALTAAASSGLPIQYSVTGPATLVGATLVSSMPGQVMVTATQTGNDVFQSATPVTITIDFQKEPLIVRSGDFTIPFGGAIPTFTYTFGNGSFTPPANQFSGVPDLTTTANSTSAPGTYPIVATTGSLVSAYYDFQFVNGTLTILQPSSFILTATPASVVIPAGQARQVTVTLTPVNDFVGTVTLACGGLPTGVSCVSSPNTLTTTLAVSGVNPVTATLTISAGAAVASAQNHTGVSRLTLASLPWGFALVLSAFLMYQRRRSRYNQRLQQLLLLVIMLAGVSGMVACGSSNKSNTVQPGTTTIQVTGSGTSTSGPSTASLALSVTIQ